jgi:hypothetical protein
MRVIELMSAKPAELFGLPGGAVAEGGPADVTVIDEKPDIVIKREGNAALFITSAGDLLVRIDDGTDDNVVRRIRQQVRVKRFVEAVNPEQRFNVQIGYDKVNPGQDESTVSTGSPAQGGVLLDGDKVRFNVRFERAVYPLLLDIDPEGGVNVLYPFDASEVKILPSGRTLMFPGSDPMDRIEVKPPFGTEYVIAYGFEQAPANLQRFLGASITPDSPLLAELEQLLDSNAKGRAQASMQLITAARSAITEAVTNN